MNHMENSSNVEVKRFPYHMLSTYSGVSVHANDGRVVGTVDEYLVDDEEKYITHLIIHKGPFWHRRDVAIPMTDVQRMARDCVYLNIDKWSVDRLPALAKKRAVA